MPGAVVLNAASYRQRPGQAAVSGSAVLHVRGKRHRRLPFDGYSDPMWIPVGPAGAETPSVLLRAILITYLVAASRDAVPAVA